MHRRVLRILPLAAALALSAAPAVAAPADQEVLPKGWQQSEDRAWATEGDSTGFRLMVADAKAGYAWRTAASLAEPGFDTDAWIGNVCFTGSGRRAVVVYAPRQFTNHDDTFQRGGFAAVVDLADGKVTKLGTTVSLAYHNPGCGTDETAVLAQNGGTKLGRTKLHVLDTATGRMVRSQELPGQITSAIPLGDRIVAADGAGVVEIDPLGGTKKLTGTAGAPSYLRADSDGGVAFLEVPDDNTAVAKHLAAGARDAKEIARGPLTELGLSAGKGGRVFLTGKPSDVKALPRTVRKVAASPRSELSSMGQVEVSQAREGSLEARMTESGKTARFQVAPDAAPAAASPSTNPVDDDRTCAVQRNDPGTQVFQPHWKQVEWAVDLAVQDALNVERPANWNQSGIPGWRPQAILPPIPLEGGGKVPAQIMLGILAQES
ncbi:MAG: hypothetical protein QOF58_252, partial [Pseudonocardiales bacterium]|nr:hypothetical protein [Pseudonocardiales bacterium]